MQIQWMWDVKSEVLLWEALANGKQREFLGVGKRSHYFQDEQLRENPSSKSTLDKVYQGFQTPEPWSMKMVSVVLGHSHCIPCCTDIRGCSRTGGNARVFNVFAMENSTWKLCNLGSNLFRGSKETFVCNFSFGGSWRSLNLMEIMAAWHLLASCFGAGTQGWMFWERLTNWRAHCRVRKAQSHGWRLLCASSVKLSFFSFSWVFKLPWSVFPFRKRRFIILVNISNLTWFEAEQHF